MRTRVLGSGESCDALAPWESVSCDCLASSDAPCPRDEGQSRDSLAHDGALVVGRAVSPGRGPVTRHSLADDRALVRRRGVSPGQVRRPRRPHLRTARCLGTPGVPGTPDGQGKGGAIP